MRPELATRLKTPAIPDLSQFRNCWYRSGRTRATEALWFLLGLPVLRSGVIPFSSVRRSLLRLFGAKIGTGVVIKPGVRVKYPWLLSIGTQSWIGEDAWIDNLAFVSIGANVCVSQGAYLCTGNHDWSDLAFGLVVKPIAIEDGCWVGARSLICPGTVMETGAIAAAGSVLRGTIPAFEIHGGNPAKFIRRREFSSRSRSFADKQPR